ncbi:MAG: hypothetical protein QXI58_04430 [Candidatus Micrarchaeia archaeon]
MSLPIVTKVNWEKFKICTGCAKKVEGYLTELKKDILLGKMVNIDLQKFASLLCPKCFENLCNVTEVTIDPRVVLGGK